MSRAQYSVMVVITTFKRPRLLAALLHSLTDAGSEISQVLVVDNANDPETRTVVEAATVKTRYVFPGSNLSCGGGLKFAMQHGLQDPATTHFWIFDDDAEATPHALATMLQAMHATTAELAVPMMLDRGEIVGWFPGLLDRNAWQFIRRPRLTRPDYLAAYGDSPVPFSWTPWPSLLVTTRAVRVAGPPRDDFWFYGDDLEFSLRLTAQFKGIFVPAAVGRHHPPTPTNPIHARQQAYLRNCLMLQNNSYCFLKLPHARRARKHLPGNFFRFFRTHGLSPTSVRDAACAFYWGGVRGQTADSPGFQEFKHRLTGTR